MNDEKEKTASVPLPLDEIGAAEPGEAAAPLLFRGLPIAWAVSQETRREVEKNAFGGDEIEERPGRKFNLIDYNGQQYTREKFYKAMFQEYKQFPYRVHFLTDDIFRLGGNQRAKLQYHILAQRFPLVAVSCTDCEELKAFAAASDSETAQRWLNRMNWVDGHEKMVSFGQALGVPDRESKGTAYGLWCYYVKIDETSATYTGVSMSWEAWAAKLMDYLNKQREERRRDMVKVIQDAMFHLYYQSSYYLTVPKTFRIAVVKWIYQYLKDGTTPFPFTGDMGSEEYTFTIDFERDVEIVPNRSIQDDMAAYNREANAEKGRRRVEKRFAELQGDKWTTAELRAQGFTKRNISSFVENGLIKRLYKGHYMRISK